MTDSFVSGKTNPMGMAADVHLEGDEAVGRVTLGPAFEGAPGRAHGGLVAALLDETMGLASRSRVRQPSPVASRSTTLPHPLGVPLEARARLTRQEGRKLTVTAELREGDTLLAEADGLFLTVDLEHFAERGPGPLIQGIGSGRPGLYVCKPVERKVRTGADRKGVNGQCLLSPSRTC